MLGLARHRRLIEQLLRDRPRRNAFEHRFRREHEPVRNYQRRDGLDVVGRDELRAAHSGIDARST